MNENLVEEMTANDIVQNGTHIFSVLTHGQPNIHINKKPKQEFQVPYIGNIKLKRLEVKNIEQLDLWCQGKLRAWVFWTKDQHRSKLSPIFYLPEMKTVHTPNFVFHLKDQEAEKLDEQTMNLAGNESAFQKVKK